MRGNRGVPVLTYHQVSAAPAPALGKYAVTRAAFAAQLCWLARAGYTSIDLNTLLRARVEEWALPARPVLITFDDGFRECVEEAVPLLRARGFTATFFLVAGLIGETSRWLERERGPALPLLAWDDVRRLAADGFACGAHSVTHPRLARLAPDRYQWELREGRRVLEAGLGREVRHLAYPHGSYDAGVQVAAGAAGYRTACSTRLGFSRPDDDPLALHRIPVNGGETMLDFVCRLWTARSCRQLVRRAAGRVVRRRARGA